MQPSSFPSQSNLAERNSFEGEKNILGPGAAKQNKPEEAKRFKIRFELLRERFVMVENVVWKSERGRMCVDVSVRGFRQKERNSEKERRAKK